MSESFKSKFGSSKIEVPSWARDIKLLAQTNLKSRLGKGWILLLSGSSIITESQALKREISIAIGSISTPKMLFSIIESLSSYAS